MQQSSSMHWLAPTQAMMNPANVLKKGDPAKGKRTKLDQS
jgi:hypothetical protein